MTSSSPEAFDDRSVRKEPKKYRQQSENHFVLQHGLQALAVGAVAVFLHAFGKPVFADPSIQVGDLLRGRDAHPLVLLDHADEVGRPAQGLDRSRVHPGIAAAEQLGRQRPFPEIDFVQTRNLQFPSGARLYQVRLFSDSRRVEIQPHNGIIGLRFLGFLFNADYLEVSVFFKFSLNFMTPKRSGSSTWYPKTVAIPYSAASIAAASFAPKPFP